MRAACVRCGAQEKEVGDGTRGVVGCENEADLEDVEGVRDRLRCQSEGQRDFV